ncbi:MAG: WxL domain-containing protein [Patescibacteria group bacterium]
MAIKQTILNRAENQVRQQLFGGLLLGVAGLMIMTTLGWSYAYDANTNMTFNITGGAFTIVNAPTTIVFPSLPFSTAANNTANNEVDGLTVTDYRGTSTAWTVSAQANNFNDGSHDIPASKMNLYAEVGALTNIAEADTNQVANGTNGTLNGSVTVFNGSTGASGIFQYDNGFINLVINGTEATGDYGAILTFTLA